MQKRLIDIATAVAAILEYPAVACAGMPSVSLTDIAEMRLNTISFFLVLGLLSAAGLRLLWNRLAREFPSVPRLSYRAAVSVTVLWGLLSLLILTMISGARELLTPGAWKKTGLTYSLTSGNPPAERGSELQIATDAERIHSLEQLKTVLWAHAAVHGGAFPEAMDSGEFAEELWLQPGVTGARYLYRPGLRMERQGQPLVVEHQVYDDRQFVLFTSGLIQPMDAAELRFPDADAQEAQQ